MTFSMRTKRLILEDLNEQDLVNIHRIAHEPRVMKYLLIWLENDDQIAEFLQNGIDEANRPDRHVYILAARMPDTRIFAGVTFLEIDQELKTTAELGCVLLPEYWGNNYASEILSEYLKLGFEKLNLHRIYGKCDELNHASSAVLERGGLRYEGTLREHVWLRDHWRSSRYYGILANEYNVYKNV